MWPRSSTLCVVHQKICFRSKNIDSTKAVRTDCVGREGPVAAADLAAVSLASVVAHADPVHGQVRAFRSAPVSIQDGRKQQHGQDAAVFY